MPQALFAAVQCIFCLVVPFGIAKFRDTIWAMLRAYTRAHKQFRLRWAFLLTPSTVVGMASDQAKVMLDSMPIAYAVTYMFGTVGSALVIALLGPLLLRINLPAACKDYEEKQGGLKEYGGAGSAWHRWETRAFRVQHGGIVNGLRAVEADH